ncbi:putative ABC transporter permease [Acetobacterium bakii]|uniref:Membrane protein n=1 Tax=Acetobacterium bakii TaxID=52689 RepID=A0A0L6U2V9_9FIRM|nr:putative ABC transporter permease [Acetobacterium bakii]KNZ42833.1 membrane protein [Acetobacterium bakii]
MYYNLSLLFTYFFLYAIIGWSCEVVYCSIPQKKFINRGFLNGPYCPIYGVGAIIIVMFLAPFIGFAPILFLMGVLITSTLEYVTSWGMEKLFHAKWWDYSAHKFNINGRICLLNSILFGVMSLVLMYGIHPFVQSIIQSFSSFWLIVIATSAGVFFIGDVIESTRETLDLNKKLGSVYEATTELKNSLKEKGINTAHDLIAKVVDLKDGRLADAKDSAHTVVMNLTNRIQENKRFSNYTHRRILNAFPNMAHRDHQESLEVYKALLVKSKKKLKSDDFDTISDGQ